jgi:hypothetical protein
MLKYTQNLIVFNLFILNSQLLSNPNTSEINKATIAYVITVPINFRFNPVSLLIRFPKISTVLANKNQKINNGAFFLISQSIDKIYFINVPFLLLTKKIINKTTVTKYSNESFNELSTAFLYGYNLTNKLKKV